MDKTRPFLFFVACAGWLFTAIATVAAGFKTEHVQLVLLFGCILVVLSDGKK